MLFSNIFSKIIKKNLIFKLRILKSFIICSFYLQIPQYQVYLFCFSSFSIRFFFCGLTFSHSSASFGANSVYNLPIKVYTRSILEVCGLGFKNYRKLTAKLKNINNKAYQMAIKKTTTFFTTKIYFLCPSLFKYS